VHDVKDEASVIGDVDLPILIRPNQLCVVLEQLAHELRHLNAEGGVVGLLDVERLGDMGVGANVDMVFRHAGLRC
jgi:hypothetical protein